MVAEPAGGNCRAGHPTAFDRSELRVGITRTVLVYAHDLSDFRHSPTLLKLASAVRKTHVRRAANTARHLLGFVPACANASFDVPYDTALARYPNVDYYM